MSSSTGKYLSSSERQQLLEILTEPNISDVDRKRIQIILFADEGKSQADIRKLLDCTAATASKWILIAESGKIDRWQKYRRGRPPKIDQTYLDRLRELISKSPRDFGYSFKRWSGVWLAQHLEKEFGVAPPQTATADPHHRSFSFSQSLKQLCSILTASLIRGRNSCPKPNGGVSRKRRSPSLRKRVLCPYSPDYI